MNNFRNVIENIYNTVPGLVNKPTVCYTRSAHPKCEIKISKPEPFNNYGDIIAQVTVLWNGDTVMNNLISCDTDLKKFCEKIRKTIQEYIILDRMENYCEKL